jgi:N-acetylmuramoyl-L-alanine amidase
VRKRLFFLLPLSAFCFVGLEIAGAAMPHQAAKPPSHPQVTPQVQPPLPQMPPQAAPQLPSRPTLGVVVLDAAHGGPDAGARGSTGIEESDVTLAYARAIRPVLEAQGFRVIETRQDNEDPSFDDRSATANAQLGAIFITLHVSSTGTPGQVRVYSEPQPAGANASEPLAPGAASGQAPRTFSMLNFPAHNGLLPWDEAQKPYAGASRRLAELMQAMMSQKFPATSSTPYAAQVRQLRTVGEPAIAIEVSSVSVTSASQLIGMGHDLAQTIARCATAFRPIYDAGAR